MHAIRHWNHQDLPSTVSALSYLRQLFRLCITTVCCTVPMSLDKNPAASPCEILKHRPTAPICHRKSTVSPVLKDHFGDHKLQRDDDVKADEQQYDRRHWRTKISSVCHFKNVETAGTMGIFLKFLHVTP